METLYNENWTLIYLVVIGAVYYTIKNIVTAVRNVKLAERGYVADEDGSTFKEKFIEEEDAKNR